jgi:hypothetical protein
MEAHHIRAADTCENSVVDPHECQRGSGSGCSFLTSSMWIQIWIQGAILMRIHADPDPGQNFK